MIQVDQGSYLVSTMQTTCYVLWAGTLASKLLLQTVTCVSAYLEWKTPGAEVAGCHKGTAWVTPATARGLATARPVPGAHDSRAILSLRAREEPFRPTAVGRGISTTGRLPRCFMAASCSCGGCVCSCGALGLGPEPVDTAGAGCWKGSAWGGCAGE